MAEPKDKLASLAERLLNRTRAGGITWEETDRSGYFVATLEGGSVTVGRPLEGPYELNVRNDRGAIMDEATVQPSNIISQSVLGTEAAKTLARLVPTLHETVRRDALNVDVTLDSLLDQLK